MSLKGFQAVTFLAIGMGMAVSYVAMQQASFRITHALPPPPESALVPVALAFLAIGAVAGMAGAALKAQATRIADLERRIAGSTH